MTKTLLIAMALDLAIVSSVAGAEKQITKLEVPRAVLDATAARYPNADMTNFAREEESGKTTFEVQLKVNGARIEIDVSPEGKILSEERTISIKELPDAVRSGLAASRYSSARVLRIEKVTDVDGAQAPTYELLVQGAKRYELVFSSTGQLTKQELKRKHED
jgi:hypothetical protein